MRLLLKDDVCFLTYEVGDEDEYVLIRLIILYICLYWSSRLAIHRSSICISICACKLARIDNVLNHADKLFFLRMRPGLEYADAW